MRDIPPQKWGKPPLKPPPEIGNVSQIASKMGKTTPQKWETHPSNRHQKWEMSLKPPQTWGNSPLKPPQSWETTTGNMEATKRPLGTTFGCCGRGIFGFTTPVGFNGWDSNLVQCPEAPIRLIWASNLATPNQRSGVSHGGVFH